MIDGNVFTTSTRGIPFIGFRAGGSGNITGKNELWTNNLCSDVPTPTTDGKYIYVLRDNGTLSCLEALTGKIIYESQRIETGTYSSSPLLANGKLYCINEEGTTTVVKAGPSFEILGVSKLDSHTLASPVAVDGRVYRVKSPAILICADAADGSILWQVRLKGPVWSTPVVADGHAYVVNHKGLVQVVRLGKKGELVGTTQIDPDVLASPAVADGALYFRTDRHLWKAALEEK